MKTEGKYILGTSNEIAEYILSNVLKENFINRKSDFTNCDFAIADKGDYDTLIVV